MKHAGRRVIAADTAAQRMYWLALPIFLSPAAVVVLLMIAAKAAAAEPATGEFAPLPHAALDDARSQVPFLAQGREDGFAYSLATDEFGRAASAGSRGSDLAQPAVRFGLGREINAGHGAFSVGGAVDLPRSLTLPVEAWNESRGAKPDFGPQFGYRSELGNHFAAEVVGSYFYTRSRWVGRTFVGWRDNDGWAIGPEAWRLGSGFSRSNGAGLAVHDVRLAPLRVGFRLGVETHSALGRRYIGGIDLSWDNP